ncbi:MAG TPA: TolC family protein [Paraburkholderia sp.]|jgi:outer membrane protein TolC
MFSVSFLSVASSPARAIPRAHALLLALIALGPPLALADARSPLSLEDAVRLAEQQAPMLEARRAAVESASDAIGPAGQLPDPELVAGIDNLPVTTGDAFSLTDDFMTMRKVGVMQTFTRHAKRDARTQHAEAGAERARALLLNERLSTREATAKAWIARWSAERRLALLQSLRPRAEAQVAAATASLSGGRGSAADGIAAQSARAMLDDRITQAQRDVDEARADFARWLPDAAERELGDAPNWSDLGVSPDSILKHVGHHRELLTYDAMEHAANADVELARAEKKPDWTVEFDFAQRGPAYSNMISLAVHVPLPLFAAHRQDPLIASKLAAAAQVEAERADALRMHTAELSKGLAVWRSALERMRRYDHELLPLADDRADAALAAYRGGRGEMQATLSAFNDAIEQRAAYAELLNALGQAWASLHFAFPQEH